MIQVTRGIGMRLMNRTAFIRLAAERILSWFDWFFRPFEVLADQTPTPQRLLWADVALVGVVVFLSALTAAWCASQMGQAYLADAAYNIWFDADTPRVFKNLLSPNSDHYRTSVHPISALTLTPPAWVLHKFVGLPQPLAAQIVIVGSAAGIAGFYVLSLRLMGIGMVATACLSALLVGSAAFLHWGGTVELFAPGGFTIMVTIAALAAGSRLGATAWIVVSALSVSITVTNWMAGLAASLVRWRRLPIIGITAAALLVVMTLSVIQKSAFSNAALFFNPRGLFAERAWIQPRMESRNRELAKWSLADNWRSIVFSTIVAPPPYLDFKPNGDVVRVSNQEMRWTKVSAVAVAATIGWFVLLCLGVWGAIRRGPHRAVAVAVGLMLAGQALLHGVYGYPTFLYSAHFLPLLVTLAAFVWFTPARRVLPALALVAAGLAAASNIPSFLDATTLMRQGLGARQERLAVLDHVEHLSQDPWPRWTGTCHWVARGIRMSVRAGSNRRAHSVQSMTASAFPSGPSVPMVVRSPRATVSRSRKRRRVTLIL